MKTLISTGIAKDWRRWSRGERALAIAMVAAVAAFQLSLLL